MRQTSILPLLSLLLGSAAAAIVVVIVLYRFHFNGPLTADSGTWGEFGDFFGGTLNPIFAFLSFTALVVTLAIQTRQLDVSVRQLEASQKELESTRLELQRSADSQAATAAALTRQAEMAALSARIAAISVAYEVTDKELATYGQIGPQHSAYGRKEQLQLQRQILLSELDAAVEKVRGAA